MSARLITLIAVLGLLLVACPDEAPEVDEPDPEPEIEQPADESDDSVDEPDEEAVDVIPQPADASPFVEGTASPDLAEGEPGGVTIVATGPYSENGAGGQLPFAVRNMTQDQILRVEVSGMAQDADGATTATGRSQGTLPNVVEPGEVSFGFVYFEPGAEVPDEATFDLTVDYQTDDEFENIRDLEIEEANLTADQIVGQLSNPYDHEIDGPISVLAVCFDEDDLTATAGTFADRDTVGPGETVSFSVDLFGADCPSFLIGGSGYYDDF